MRLKNIFQLIAITSLSFIMMGCEDDDPDTIEYNARVLGPSLDCGDAYLIELIDTENAPDFVETSYVEINLPESYKINDLLLQISYRSPQESELLSCTTQGFSYSQIYITVVHASE